jgi:hypothetical protein
VTFWGGVALAGAMQPGRTVVLIQGLRITRFAGVAEASSTAKSVCRFDPSPLLWLRQWARTANAAGNYFRAPSSLADTLERIEG